MADVKVTLKRVTDAQGNTDTIKPTTDWDQVENKPSTFTPTAHTLNSHSDVNATPTEGQVLTWDAVNEVWISADSAGGGDVSKSDLQNVYIYGKASAAITIGQAVQFDGAQGDHILIKPAVQSEINLNPDYVIGIAETTLAENDFGYVLVNGRLTLDTTGYTAGSILYFDSEGTTAGALTATEPTEPNAIVQLAAVSIGGNGNGEFVVRTNLITRNIHEINGLQNALDAKVSKSGDTMTGNLTISTGASTSALTLKSNSGYNAQVLFNNGETLRSAITSIDADGNLAFYHNGGDKLVIDNSGNVGIGTTSPSTKLQVYGEISTNYQSSEFNAGGVRTFADMIGGTKLARIGTVSGGDTLTGEQGALGLYTRGSEKLRINVNGDVGIGTSNPGKKLHIVGDARVEGDLTVNGTVTMVDTNTSTTEQWIVTNDGTGPAAIINQTGAQPVIDIQDDGVSAFYIEDGGNVGIGTTDPGYKLEVNGSISMSGSSQLRGKLSTGTNVPLIGIGGDNAIAIGSGVANTLANIKFFPGGSEAMRIKSDGNVGIGIASPSSKLSINQAGTNDTDGLWLYSGATPSNGGIALFKSGHKLGSIQSLGGDSSISFITNDAGTNYERMRINDVGNVGIGTTSPSSPLTVAGDIRTTGSSGNRARLLLVSSADQPNDLLFGANGTEYWSITSRESSNPFLGLYNTVGSPGWAWTISNATNVMDFTATPTVNGTSLVTSSGSISGSSGSVVRTVGGTSSAELVRGNMADNDQFRILVGGTGSNAGYAEIATADDGNEPIYVRQYTGVFATLNRTLTLLDGSGNTVIPQSLYIGGSTNGGRFYSDEWGIKIGTNDGHIQFGPANTGHAHIYTDRPNFYFNKELLVNGSGVWHSGNFNPASYLTTSGKAADSELLDGLDSSAYLRDDGWNNYPGQDANTQANMRADFTYSNNAPVTGSLISFGAGGYQMQFNSQYAGDGNELYFRSRQGDVGTWNTWKRVWHDGHFSPANFTPARVRTNWNDSTVINNVVGQLVWKNYGNGHTIFDASASTSPDGGAIDRTNSQVAWSASYPTLMGWNGSNTFGVRVDSARVSDSTSFLGGNFDSPGRNYSREWIEMPNFSGLYSPQNSAHFYPNNATYGAWRLAGSRNGWGGIEFDGSNGGVTLMMATSSNTVGMHANNHGWKWLWESGTMYVFKNTYGGGTQATVWDSVNLNPWRQSGSWLGDLGSNGYTREAGLSMTGGSEFVVLSKGGQGSTLVDGHYLSYENNNGFFGSYDSSYGNLTGIQATAASTLTVKQLDGGNADLAVTGTVSAGGNKLAWVRTQGTTNQSGINFTISGTTLFITTTL